MLWAPSKATFNKKDQEKFKSDENEYRKNEIISKCLHVLVLGVMLIPILMQVVTAVWYLALGHPLFAVLNKIAAILSFIPWIIVIRGGYTKRWLSCTFKLFYVIGLALNFIPMVLISILKEVSTSIKVFSIVTFAAQIILGVSLMHIYVKE